MIDQLSFNLKCAKFLGWKSAFAHEGDRYGYIQTVDGFNTPFYNDGDPQLVEMNSDLNIHSVSQLKFHYDWNWIMEVIEAISDKFGKAPLFQEVYQKWLYEDTNTEDFLIFRSSKQETIQAIDQFLDWIEKNSK